MRKKTGVALGSGGARGLCGIGVLLWMKENGIKIDCISGTSIGSLIGGAYAAGFSPEYMKELALKIGWKDYLTVVRLSFSLKSVLDWEKIRAWLSEDLGGRKIEELDIPFACVASDIDSGREFVFKEGDLLDAIGASACIPGVFPPVELLGRHLVDGELVNPVPLDLAIELGAERVIGINASRSVFTERLSQESGHLSLIDKVDGWVKESLEKTPLISSISPKKWLEEHSGEKKRRRNIIDVITDSLAIVSSRILALEQLRSGPHFMINPPVGGFQTFDFDRAEEIIESGYREAESVGDDLIRFIEG